MQTEIAKWIAAVKQNHSIFKFMLPYSYTLFLLALQKLPVLYMHVQIFMKNLLTLTE